MRDLPMGVVVATVSICSAVVMVCIACVVAWYPSMKRELRALLPEDAEPPSFPAETHAFQFPPAPVRPFSQSGAKGIGNRKPS